jgi:hypothetical protein
MFKLWNRQRGAHNVRRLRGDDRGRRIHNNQKLLCFGGDIRGAERFWREREAGKDVDLVANHQFLREALGDVRVRAAGVLAYEFDLLAGNRVAVLLHEQLDAIVHLRGGVGKLAGVGHDQADLDGVLRLRGAGKRERGDGR